MMPALPSDTDALVSAQEGQARGKYVCKLKKGLYGLKQSPRLWAATLTAWLLAYGFKAATSTDCLYIFRAGSVYIYLIYWVDDMLLISNSICEELGYDCSEPTMIYEDNQACISL